MGGLCRFVGLGSSFRAKVRPITMNMPDLSVLIPTHNRPDKLRACLRGLASQSLAPHQYEVLVGFDGPEPETQRCLESEWTTDAALRVFQFEKRGYREARNDVARAATGEYLVSLNDDVIPEREFLAEHLRAQRRSQAEERTDIYVGASPWVVHQPDRLFDQLIRETSMVFFYDQMDNTDLSRDWGFRHCYGLNHSVRTDVAHSVGFYTEYNCDYGYEDIDFAFKVAKTARAQIRYVPAARAPHDHRMDPADYLRRERTLGYCALGFAEMSPECALAVFGCDILDASYIEFVRDEWEKHVFLMAHEEKWFRTDLVGPPLTGSDAKSRLQAIYERHRPLKRQHWRRGLLDAWEDAQRRRPGTGDASGSPVARSRPGVATSPAGASTN